MNEGDQIVFNDDGTLAKITQYYGAAMAGQLYEEGAITNEQVRMVVSQLNNSERSFSDVLKLLATTVNDPGVFKRALQVFAEGVASNVEGSATFYIQNMQPVPQAVVESITNHRFFLDQFKAFVEGEGNVEQMISHADRILPERQQIPVMVQSLARYAHDVVSNVQKEVLEYNKTVGEHNLLQTEEALKILRGRGVIAAHEEKINEAVQKKTDFVYEGVERMLQKMLLRNGDLSQNGNDDRQGR